MSERELPADVEDIAADQDWLPELFQLAGLAPEADLETIKSKMGALADKSAPITRTEWNWIVFLQGLAICVPLGWLLGFPVPLVGLAGFGTILLLWILTWWLRRRSMQKTWARARLVTEAARSLIATSRYPSASPRQTFAAVPALRHLWSARPPVSPPELSVEKWIEEYVTKRIATQEKYFTDKRKEAEVLRKKLSSWTSILLDVALVFACAGLVLVFAPSEDEWMVGGTLSESALGSMSILVLLGLLLIQIVRELHEVNRRTARFAQQQRLLLNARRDLARSQTPELALEVVSNTESKLLDEVLEWYFHAETAERFVELREPAGRTLPKSFFKDATPAEKLARALPGKVGTASLSLLSVIIRRLPFMLLPAAAVVVYIFYWLPQQGINFKRLENEVYLRADDDKTLFDSAAREAKAHGTDFGKNGYVVLAHGLYGRGSLTGNKRDDDRNWIKDCAVKIKERMKDNKPEICLVDWTEAATPSNFYNRVFGERSYLADIPAIRPQAYRVGDIVAFQLAGIILKNGLPRDVPFHLIGHSAGGFVVTRVAIRLAELGVVRSDSPKLHVTILDTPAPDEEITKDLPDLYPDKAVDFYISSVVGGRLETTRAAQFSPKIDKYDVPAETSPDTNWGKAIYHKVSNLWEDHRQSFKWYMRTIEHPEDYPGQGFNHSPLVLQEQAIDDH